MCVVVIVWWHMYNNLGFQVQYVTKCIVCHNVRSSCVTSVGPQHMQLATSRGSAQLIVMLANKSNQGLWQPPAGVLKMAYAFRICAGMCFIITSDRPVRLLLAHSTCNWRTPAGLLNWSWCWPTEATQASGNLPQECSRGRMQFGFVCIYLFEKTI